MIHDALPSGFALANRLQVDEYERTGNVHGASKLCLVDLAAFEGRTGLAVRLRPPRRWGDVISPIARSEAFRRGIALLPETTDALEWYVTGYNRGWAAGKRSGHSRVWNSGHSSAPFEDGYLDAATGRPKWHNTYCTDHDNCGEA